MVLTERLRLVPLGLELIDAVLAGDIAAAQRLAPYPLDATTFAGDEHVLGLRQAQLRADPGIAAWLYRAAVTRNGGTVVGKGGCHAAPDGEGTVEIGYRVGPAWRRRGYGAEIAAGLVGWAREQGARRCLASISPGNTASERIVSRLGFVRVGEQLDEIDGVEWVYALDLR